MSPDSAASPMPPKQVRSAITFIWLSFAVTVCSWMLVFFLPTPPLVQRYADNLGLSVGTLAALRLIAFIVPGTIIYFVLRHVAKGVNWARILCLIAGLAALPEALYRLISMDNALARLVSAGTNFMYLGFGYYALYLLFISPGKTWFRKK